MNCDVEEVKQVDIGRGLTEVVFMERESGMFCFMLIGVTRATGFPWVVKKANENRDLTFKSELKQDPMPQII